MRCRKKYSSFKKRSFFFKYSFFQKRTLKKNTVSFSDVATGTSIDWFMGVLKSNFSYCIELPSQDFIISEDKIQDIGLEIFEAFKVLGKYINDNFT